MEEYYVYIHWLLLPFRTYYSIKSYTISARSAQAPQQRAPGSMGLSTTSLPTRILQNSKPDFDLSTDEENEPSKNYKFPVGPRRYGSRVSLPTSPQYHMQGGANKFRFRNTSHNGIRRLR